MTQQELERVIQEVWSLFKETDKKFKEADIIIKEMGRKVDALIGRWGIFVEELIVPSVRIMFKRWGIEVDKVFQRVKVHRNMEGTEIIYWQ